MTTFDDCTHFFVDYAGDFLAVTLFRLVVATDEDFAVATVVDRSDTVAHAPFCNHTARLVGDHLDVAACAGAVVFDDEFLGNASTESHGDVVKQFLTADVAVVVVGTAHCVTCGLSARDDCNFVYRVAILQQTADDCVTCFVVGGDTLVRFGDEARLLGRAHDNLVDTFVDVFHRDYFASVANGKNCRFV